MVRPLDDREKRVVRLGAGVAAVLLAATVGRSGLDRWSVIRAENDQLREKLASVQSDSSDLRQKGIVDRVPVFQMPVGLDKQRSLFRDKLHEQIKKAGLEGQPLQAEPMLGKAPLAGYGRLNLKFSGKGRMQKVLDLLVDMKANPYLAAVEELTIKCDPKKSAGERQDVGVDMVISTWVRQTNER